MRKYEPDRGTKKTKKREQLYKKLESAEQRYHHKIPIPVVNRILKKTKMSVHRGFRKKNKIYLSVDDAKGRSQGSIAVNKKTKKIFYWFVK
jgi:hypothetical protein